MKKRVLVWVCVLLILAVAYLIFSRPVTPDQLYPMLSPEKCVEIRGYYVIGTQKEATEFSVAPDTEAFESLYDLFFTRSYRRSLKDLLPRGTRYHSAEPEDFRWEVFFSYEDVEFPDGSRGSGPILQFYNWYGELDLFFAGERHVYHTKGQENWAKVVLDTIG